MVFKMFFSLSYTKEDMRRRGKIGWRTTTKGRQIKADMLTPKPDINQLPGNRKKDRKKKRQRGGGGHQSVVKILGDAVEVCGFLHVHVSERRGAC